MKMIFSFIALLLASNAWALNPNSTWEEIFAQKNVTLIFEEPIGDLKLDNACLTESEVRSIQDIKFCTELVKVQKGENKDKWTDWVCRRWTVGAYSYPRTFDSESLAVRVIAQYQGRPGETFQKIFTFPACQ
jgi:hypothetical protein